MTDVRFNRKKVAVIIPCFNAQSTIDRAIQSSILQDLPDGYDLEVIVVDDCSTDDTFDKLQTHAKASNKLRVFRQRENAGPSAARNRALAETDALWFTPLDSDDYMQEGRLTALLEKAKRDNLDFVGDNLVLADIETPDVPQRTLWPEKPSGNIDMDLAFFVEHNLEAENQRAELGYLKPLLRRTSLEDPKAPYRSDMRFGEDYDLYCRILAAGGKAALIDEAGYFALQREGSLSRTPSATDFEKVIETDRALLASPSVSAMAKQMVRRHKAETEKEWVWVRTIEAVKAKNPLGIASSFLVSFQASTALVGKLIEQVIIRTRRSVISEASS